jgi:hypothetical protein
MRSSSVFNTVVTIAGLAIGACSDDEQVPGDDLAAKNQTPVIRETTGFSPDTADPEGLYQGDEYQARACHVKLVYCKDPRWSPHYPSYCSNGCNADHAFDVAQTLCHRICGNVSCSPMYVLGGC